MRSRPAAADRAKDCAKPVISILGVAEGHPDSPSAITQRPDLTRLTRLSGPDPKGQSGGIDVDLVHLGRRVE